MQNDQTSVSNASGAATTKNNNTSETNKDTSLANRDEVSGPIIKVVNEAMFVKMMSERATSRQWRAIECIQSTIKANRGLGRHIPIRFAM